MIKNTIKSKRVKKINKPAEHIELQKILIKRFAILLSIVLSLLILVFFFSPLIGSFFGLLSVNRNKDENINDFKPNSPVLIDIPEATKETSINVKGYGQAGLTAKLFVNGPEVATGIVGNDGLFTFDNIKLNPGTRNTIYAKIADPKGNESDKSNTFIVMQDKDKPKIEIVSPKNDETIRNLDKRITILGEVSEKGELKINKRLAIIKPDLTFEFLLGVDEGEVVIQVEATDIAGNTAEKSIKVRYEKDN